MKLLQAMIEPRPEKVISKNILVIDVPKLGREAQIVKRDDKTLLLLDTNLLKERRAVIIASVHDM